MIETKKLTDSTLKRITKSNNTYEDVHITDVPSNVLENGTNITDEVLSNINYKDDQNIEFSISNGIVTPPNGKAVIYALDNGKLFFSISGYSPFEISANQAFDLIKKKGTTYVSNGQMEYFNLGSSMKLFSTGTKIGTIPHRNEETSSIIDATYFDITDDEIEALICGNTKLKIQTNNVCITNLNSKIEMNYGSKITISSNDTKLEIDNDRFYLSTPTSDIGVDSNNNKLNCHTNLNKASYGNNKFRIQMEDTLRIKNNLNNQNIVSINQNGEIIINDILLETYIKSIASREVRRHKEMHQIFSGSSTSYDGYFLTNMNYVFYFSDNPSSTLIMSIEINGQDIEDMINNKIYIPKTNSYYYLEQYEASGVDGDDIDTLYIYKCNNGIHTPAYFRQIYEEY